MVIKCLAFYSYEKFQESSYSGVTFIALVKEHEHLFVYLISILYLLHSYCFNILPSFLKHLWLSGLDNGQCSG